MMMSVTVLVYGYCCVRGTHTGDVWREGDRQHPRYLFTWCEPCVPHCPPKDLSFGLFHHAGQTNRLEREFFRYSRLRLTCSADCDPSAIITGTIY